MKPFIAIVLSFLFVITNASPAFSPAVSPAVSPAASPDASPDASPAISPDVSPAIPPADFPSVFPITNNTDGPDIQANWRFQAFGTGACGNGIIDVVGTSSSGCQNLPQIASSYRFFSSVDPQTGASFTLSLYSSQNCNNFIVNDNGKNGACNTILFESWQVLITVG